MRITVANRQSIARVNAPALRRLAEHLTTRLTKSGARRWTGLTVVVTDDAGSLDAKARCFGMQVVTDVVAAAYAPIPGRGPAGWTADVIVNVERALNAARHSGEWSPSLEFALYLAHGIDHLCGGRDHTAKGRQAMRRRELGWLRSVETRRLARRLLRAPREAVLRQRTLEHHAD